MKRKITGLTVQKRNPNRVNVYLDGEFGFGLARIVAAWLKVGQELEPERIETLLGEDALEKAYQRAIKFLSYRPRSEREVAQNLRKHEVPEVAIEDVLGRLREKNYVNDADFARMWVENRSAFRPKGRRALRMELRQKGITDTAIEVALETLDEERLAFQAARKKTSQLRRADNQEFRKKMYGYLARRGFNNDAISPVIRKLLEERENNENEEIQWIQ